MTNLCNQINLFIDGAQNNITFYKNEVYIKSLQKRHKCLQNMVSSLKQIMVFSMN